MTAHKRVPNRRHAETFELTVGGLRYVCTVGRFGDGMIGELFFSNHESNSTADTNARDAAAKTASTASRRIPRVEGDAMQGGSEPPTLAGTASPPRWLKYMSAQPLRSKLHHPASHHYAVVDAGGVQL
jgi:hypothetical protein